MKCKKRGGKFKRTYFKNRYWLGSSKRSYVLQPYQLVKDLRNKTESTNPISVLDGNIDQFIEEELKIKNEKIF